MRAGFAPVPELEQLLQVVKFVFRQTGFHPVSVDPEAKEVKGRARPNGLLILEGQPKSVAYALHPFGGGGC